MYQCEILADSESWGHRATTFLITYPRIIHAEVMTHRMLSKSSASSRAIPVSRMLKMVIEDPFIPSQFPREHSGMQASAWITKHESPVEYEICVAAWLCARDVAVAQARMMLALKVSKQIINRILEAYLWHTIVITGTAWDNFFALRVHKDAQLEIQIIAEMMMQAYRTSKPRRLQAGEWHLPFSENIDDRRIDELYVGPDDLTTQQAFRKITRVKISMARSARSSFLNFEGKDDYVADIALHDRLVTVKPVHASPAEHCLCAMSNDEYWNSYRGTLHVHSIEAENNADENETYIYIQKGFDKRNFGWCRNFQGFRPYRDYLEEETVWYDERLYQEFTL